MASIGIFEFGGERHEVHLSVQIGSIRIRVRNGEKSWANTFQSHYIEQLTEKTGAFKNFNLFTSILANAISNPGKRLLEHVPSKVGCVSPMFVVSVLLHAKFGPNDHRENVSHFINMNFRNEWLHAGTVDPIRSRSTSMQGQVSVGETKSW